MEIKISVFGLTLLCLLFCPTHGSKVEDDHPFVWSSLTNNSFEFVVYKDHHTTKNVYDCYDYIYQRYQCLTREKQIPIVDSLLNGEKSESALAWLKYKDLKMVKEINRELQTLSKFSPYFRWLDDRLKYPALYAHIRWSGSYGRYISERGSPGIWSCFMDFLVKEYQEMNDLTLNNNVLFKDGKLVTLYSGIRDPVKFNISKNDGSPNVRIGDLITVSGYLSTTTSKKTANEFAQGWTGPANHPIVIVITPLKEKSKAASLTDFLSYEEQSEFLFPTNVAFKVKAILEENEFDPYFKNRNLAYMLVVEETKTESIQREVEGKDPNEQNDACKYKYSSAASLSISIVFFALLGIILSL